MNTTSPIGESVTAHFARMRRADPALAAAHEALRPQADLARDLITYRMQAEISQRQLAARLRVKPSVVTMLEYMDLPLTDPVVERVREGLRALAVALP